MFECLSVWWCLECCLSILYVVCALTRGGKDSKSDRENYFGQCLRKMAELQVMKSSKTSVACPYGIGCGLAGGDWSVYMRMIKDFSRQVHLLGCSLNRKYMHSHCIINQHS